MDSIRKELGDDDASVADEYRAKIEEAQMPDDVPRRLLEYLAEGLVDEPDAVSVEQFEEDDGTIVLELCVGADDYGRVIGRGGTEFIARDGRCAA